MKLFFSATRLVIIEVFFVGAAAIVTNLFVPAAGEHLLLTRILAVALFVGAPSGVFVDQDSFNEPHVSPLAIGHNSYALSRQICALAIESCLSRTFSAVALDSQPKWWV